MKIFFAFILVVAGFKVNAQVISQDSVPGTWQCTGVKELPSEELQDSKLKSRMEILKKGFYNSIFVFHTSGIFSMVLSSSTENLSQMPKVLHGKKWYFSPDTQQISIGKPEENLMHINLKMEKDTVYFKIQEIPMELKMKKIK